MHGGEAAGTEIQLLSELTEEKALKLTIKQTLPVWWSLAWRATLYGLILGFAFGVVGGVIAALNDPSMAPIYGAIGGYLAAVPASMFALKQALSRHLASLAECSRPRELTGPRAA